MYCKFLQAFFSNSSFKKNLTHRLLKAIFYIKFSTPSLGEDKAAFFRRPIWGVKNVCCQLLTVVVIHTVITTETLSQSRGILDHLENNL
jgi:hypothetical protein